MFQSEIIQIKIYSESTTRLFLLCFKCRLMNYDGIHSLGLDNIFPFPKKGRGERNLHASFAIFSCKINMVTATQRT